MRLYIRDAHDWTARLSAIAAAAECIKAKSFTIDGEAVVVGPDGLSRFEELSRREAARTAFLYGFDLIELDGEDLRCRPFLDRKAALAQLLGDVTAGMLLNEHIAEDGPTVFAQACRLGAKGIVSKRVDGAGDWRGTFASRRRKGANSQTPPSVNAFTDGRAFAPTQWRRH